MAYDEDLADRVRRALEGTADVKELRMFGGLAFLVAGNMACGVIGEELMVRLGEEGADAALDEPHTRPMDFTGRPMTSMAFVEPAGLGTDAELRAWVDRAVRFASSLPAKRAGG